VFKISNFANFTTTKKIWPCEHIASATPRALEGAHVSEGPLSLGFVSFTVNKADRKAGVKEREIPESMNIISDTR
jgi:hypothetical protein